ncbi:MAG: winged helix-turn-helix domain-containing protein [Candidatus Micrarchaeota archaeon]
MAGEIVLDQESFKALASGKRVALLKSLLQRRKTASEAAKEAGVTVQTASEHLKQLEGAGLVQRAEDGRKWVYYELTGKGRAVVEPSPKNFLVLLALSVLSFTAAFWRTAAYNLQTQTAGGAAPLAEALPQAAAKAIDAAQATPLPMASLPEAGVRIIRATAEPLLQAVAEQGQALAQAAVQAATNAPAASAPPAFSLTPLETGLAVAGALLLAAAVYLRVKNQR